MTRSRWWGREREREWERHLPGCWEALQVSHVDQLLSLIVGGGKFSWHPGKIEVTFRPELCPWIQLPLWWRLMCHDKIQQFESEEARWVDNPLSAVWSLLESSRESDTVSRTRRFSYRERERGSCVLLYYSGLMLTVNSHLKWVSVNFLVTRSTTDTSQGKRAHLLHLLLVRWMRRSSCPWLIGSLSRTKTSPHSLLILARALSLSLSLS